MINNNYINAENNYSIDIDLETGKFSCRYTLKGQYNNKQYPLGTFHSLFLLYKNI